jgi:hypothetical protein
MSEDNNPNPPPPPHEAAEAPKNLEVVTPTSEDGVIIGERGKAMGAKPLMMLDDVPGMPDVPPSPTNLDPAEGITGGSTPASEDSASPSESSSKE